MPTCVVCAQALLDGGGHPDGRCPHWMCSDCQLDYTGPVFCPCEQEVDEELGRPAPAALAPTTPVPMTRADRTPNPPTVMRPTRLSFV